ncbi:hypothetical protein ACFLYI_02065 [Chloroflexota bacterium]
MGTKAEPQPGITVRIVPGKALPAQSQAWLKFFTRLIAECQRELKAESEAKHEH